MEYRIEQLLSEIASLLELLRESLESFVETFKGVPDLIHIRALEKDSLTTRGASEVGLSIVPSKRLIECVTALRASYPRAQLVP